MFIPLIGLFGLLLTIALTRRLALKYLYLAGGHSVHSPRLVTYGVALLLLPGTLIHELSHWLVAELLRVPTGKLAIFPQIDKADDIRLGSLQIGRADPFRRTLIGLAPLFAGLTALFLLGSQLPPLNQPPTLTLTFKNLAWFYGAFVVANTMFSSQKDLEVALLPAFVLILGGVLLWRLPLDLALPTSGLTTSQDLLNRLNQVLAVVLGLNFLWLVLWLAIHKALRH